MEIDLCDVLRLPRKPRLAGPPWHASLAVSTCEQGYGVRIDINLVHSTCVVVRLSLNTRDLGQLGVFVTPPVGDHEPFCFSSPPLPPPLYLLSPLQFRIMFGFGSPAYDPKAETPNLNGRVAVVTGGK